MAIDHVATKGFHDTRLYHHTQNFVTITSLATKIIMASWCLNEINILLLNHDSTRIIQKYKLHQ
jgi:hypothetical protein